MSKWHLKSMKVGALGAIGVIFFDFEMLLRQAVFYVFLSGAGSAEKTLKNKCWAPLGAPWLLKAGIFGVFGPTFLAAEGEEASSLAGLMLDSRSRKDARHTLAGCRGFWDRQYSVQNPEKSRKDGPRG